uniref:Flavin-containing monooxygenase n=2 Tax=Leptobrachium leishanense TaxID=445787 RepID=A0A8C5MG73_9ANUR
MFGVQGILKRGEPALTQSPGSWDVSSEVLGEECYSCVFQIREDNHMKMTSNRIRVAVIGAGAAGLCSARNLLSRPHAFQPPVVFERSLQVGGTWVYSEEPETESHQHSSMYRDLRTNLPKEIMEFPDYSFDPSLPSFIHRSEVLRYLEEYTENFHVRPHIRFNCNVIAVSPVSEDGVGDRVRWDVTSHIWENPHPVTERFDAVMVCAGHYSQPYVPDIPGIDTFQGKLLHSHVYRYPESFTSRSVVLLGCGPSGIDIAIELAQHAKQVTLCHHGPPIRWTPPKGLSLAPPVVRATPDSLICEDGTQLEADTLIFCTGYKYCYPFLESKMDPRSLKDTEELVRVTLPNSLSRSGLLLETQNGHDACNDQLKEGMLAKDTIVIPDEGQGHLPPLYKHLIHARYPTLVFIGACKIVVPFPHVHCQALFFLAVLEGKCPLPSVEQMLSESYKELMDHMSVGLPLKYLHRLAKDQWDYNQWLSKTAGFKPLPPVLRKIYDKCSEFRNTSPIIYRSLKFEILSSEEFRVNSTDAQI